MTTIPPRGILTLGDTTIDLDRGPLIQGIVNVTPDSFSDGGRYFDPARAIAHAENLIADGADWIDIGGESTRPGATPVSEKDELRRVLPVIEGLAGRVTASLSIDTYKPAVAREALRAGATILNDVTGFRDPAMLQLATETSATCICMHLRGTPQTMQQLADYDDVVAELAEFFHERLRTFAAAGIDPTRVVLDPGIGFAKRKKHNLAILRHLDELCAIGRPILLGTSRKSLLGELTGQTPDQRLAASIASALAGYYRGASIFRVHDVRALRDALTVAAAIEQAERS